MKTIGINANNDIYRAGDNNLGTVTDEEAVEQMCWQAVSAVRGEMIYAADRGVPYFDIVFNNTNLVQFEAIAREEIELVPGVIEVKEFDVSLNGEVVEYTATIRTEYGDIALNG